ncbi:MOSC domain-containing protein [Alkalilimnicola ehrlichii]|uniref:MOSC domain-containing protein n=1 Tax=Alkalilimnicola ehrlichii TaxID=351052 RepID=A0A3E0WTD4_9GAMM|nr:MOSC domain-containing protein [Alkalilimnicola ehrlichii]RFA27235.1 MOSC domain-containing protein [Alkalilimnicola ehrlichii]RFA35411.1 MOSC domain-containing protein [Alkalilimnicola ehrlichii]
MAAVIGIYTAEKSGAPVGARDAVEVRRGCGIVGDRHFRPNGANAADQITLIEQEAVTAFNEAHGLSVAPWELRRNLVTEGIDLNALVGREFQVGAVRLRGIELCEPCATVGRLLQQPELSPTQVIKALMGKGGLRAEIVSTGVIRIGDAVCGSAAPAEV